MTVLAVTSIQRSTLDEKVAGNLRSQELAFQAAEAALRYCQKSLESTGQDGHLPLLPGVTQTNNGIKILAYPVNIVGTALPSAPIKWAEKNNWTSENVKTLDAQSIRHVAAQPQCMIEEYPIKDKLKPKVYVAYVITSRGVGGTSDAIVWLQQTLRVGNNLN
jgi:type IV pilus assembly protein PilX